jgi:subtilisin family serine protease
VERGVVERWIYGAQPADDDERQQRQRFTQDSPVLPDVWLSYGRDPEAQLKLLLTPHAASSPSQLKKDVEERLAGEELTRTATGLAYNQGFVAVDADFRTMVRAILPLSEWWAEHLWPEGYTTAGRALRAHRDTILARLGEDRRHQGRRRRAPEDVPGNLVWFVALAGRISGAPDSEDYEAWLDAAAELVSGLPAGGGRPSLWSVTRNRRAQTTVWRSRISVKADAAIRLFHLSCRDVRWAIIDSGIDARHPAFRREDADSNRIVAAYDFTRFRDIVATHAGDVAAGDRNAAQNGDVQAVATALDAGQAIDWSLFEPLLRVPYDDGAYQPPGVEHGTHVAGILGANLPDPTEGGLPGNDVVGICPDIELYDLRVFDDQGAGDEFGILAALQFVRYLNSHSPTPRIHGVNLSLSLEQDVSNYACGRTPVCLECERLVSAGTVVVVAAGNDGRARYETSTGQMEGYRVMSITDPGNTEAVITVGATHRTQPHNYGVSYFSSRGPTGDGRSKPDLVAPGEKITAPVPNGEFRALDGTSMAAPHVSGAAALLMARHPELIGQPGRIKEVLCATATDLGRDRLFQGAGVVDSLRAIQAV